MDNMQRRLEEARTRLLNAQEALRIARQHNIFVRWHEEFFLAAIDRAWEAQCMARGSL